VWGESVENGEPMDKRTRTGWKPTKGGGALDIINPAIK
jgi:hypothetical protein